MKGFSYSLIIFFQCLFLACQSGDETIFRLASDFEENEKIYVVYIPQPYIVELISTLSKYENIGVLVQSIEEIPEVDVVLERSGTHTHRLSYGVFPGADQWIRDSSPAILKNQRGELQAVEFLSSKQAFRTQPGDLARSLRLPSLPSRINAQGGARESNGDGTVIVTESFFKQAYDEFDKKALTKEWKKDFGLKKVIWLPQGLIEDEIFEQGPIYDNLYSIGSGGHVDEFCRFTSSSTVLLAEVDSADLLKHPLYQINHKRLENSYRILRKNKELEIIRTPVAEFIFDTISSTRDQGRYPVVLTGSYMNFVIGNQVIIAARYYQTGMPLSVKEKDEKMYEILKNQFPSHQIVQLDPRRLNMRGGGFHCVTFNLPSGKPKLKNRKQSKIG